LPSFSARSKPVAKNGALAAREHNEFGKVENITMKRVAMDPDSLQGRTRKFNVFIQTEVFGSHRRPSSKGATIWRELVLVPWVKTALD
jgi:hypothetical protein